MRRAVKFLASAAVAAAGLIAIGGAQAQSLAARNNACQLRIDSSAGNWIIDGYDPFSGNASTGTFDVVFVNEGDGDCRFRPIFQTDVAAFGLETTTGGTRVPYTLLDTYGQYDATPLGGRTVRRVNNRPVVIGPHGQQLVRYVFNVDLDSLPGDGLFTQRTMLQAEQVDGTPLAERQLTLGIRVLPSASMTLAGSFSRVNGRADVDLGELQEGVAKVPLQLHVRSTRAYRLGVESLNNGKLRLAGSEWAVPYHLLVDGRAVTMGSASAYSSSTRTGYHLDNLPLTFSVDKVGEVRAGTYSDVITISVAAI